MSDDLPEIRSALVKQVDEIIDEETTAVELVSQLTVSRYQHNDSSGTRGAANSFEPMFKAVLLRELEGWSDPELRRKLNDSETAKAFGFNPDHLPSRSTFYRARTSRFKDAERTIERSVEQIRELAQERGSPIGLAFEPNEADNTSQRNERRELRKRTVEVIEEMENVVFPALHLPQESAAVYNKDDLLMVETLAGIATEDGLNGAGDTYGDILDPNGELTSEHPFYMDGPTGETVLRAIHQLKPVEITEMVNRAARKAFMRVRPYEEFPKPVTVAIDITYVAYYGDREGMTRVTKVPPDRDKEYEWCHKYATANIVGENTHFVLAMLPVGDPDHHDADAYPGKDKTHRPGAIVRDLLEIIRDTIPVQVVYADKEFYSAETIAALEYHDLMYVLPIPSSATRDLEAKDGEVTVKHDHVIHGPVKHGVTNEPILTTAVILPADEERESDQPFATNLEVDDEIGLDRRMARKKIERYRERGGIETAYSKIKQFGGMTTSRSFCVRLFHFGMSVLLYNMWLLVDFLVQRSMKGEVSPKPRITADRFRRFTERLLEQLRPG